MCQHKLATTLTSVPFQVKDHERVRGIRVYLLTTNYLWIENQGMMFTWGLCPTFYPLDQNIRHWHSFSSRFLSFSPLFLVSQVTTSGVKKIAHILSGSPPQLILLSPWLYSELSHQAHTFQNDFLTRRKTPYFNESIQTVNIYYGAHKYPFDLYLLIKKSYKWAFPKGILFPTL